MILRKIHVFWGIWFSAQNFTVTQSINPLCRHIKILTDIKSLNNFFPHIPFFKTAVCSGTVNEDQIYLGNKYLVIWMTKYLFLMTHYTSLPFRAPLSLLTLAALVQGRRRHWSQEHCRQILPLPPSSCLNLHESLHFSGQQFPHLQNANKGGVVWGLSDSISVTEQL